MRSVRFLGSSSALGVSGQEVFVELPPPPRVTETLLPEVRAALDDRVRQDDLEASLYAEPEDDDEGVEEDEELVLDGLEQEPFEGVHARPALRRHLVDEDETEGDLADTPRHRLP
ncbi:MAG: hypothetical protein P8Z81_08505 [Deinococcales bacterium]